MFVLRLLNDEKKQPQVLTATKLGYGLLASSEMAQYDFCFFHNKIKSAKMSFPGMSLKFETIADRFERISKCHFELLTQL